MKKILIGALAALTVMSFGTITEAADYDDTCCRGNYCYAQDGDYCGRYGCDQGYGQGYGCGRGYGYGRGGR